MILLKDGVKYFPHSYASEEELEKMVIEHYKEIFGERSLYFDEETMRTRAGIGARNDGIIISLHENKWFILEVELSEHDPYAHVVPQITKFFNAYKSLETRKKITNTLYQAIKADLIKTAILQKEKIEDIHKFLTDLIDSQPTIAIVIDSKTGELDEVCESLPFPTMITEFETFVREEADISVHVHRFEPLWEEKVHAVFDEGEKGFFCRMGDEKHNTEWVYSAGEIVEHLRDEHDIDPNDQIIEGWNDDFEKEWKEYHFKKEKLSKKARPSGITKMPKTLEQILATVKAMYQGSSFTEAVKKAAKQYGVEESTIRDKCTRRLDLNTDQFIEITQDKTRLKSLLQERFPNYKDLIINEV
ncbi:MAG: hypothetical protein ACUVRA_07345 [Candidatus Bathyarchaeaceae archaeon]